MVKMVKPRGSSKTKKSNAVEPPMNEPESAPDAMDVSGTGSDLTGGDLNSSGSVSIHTRKYDFGFCMLHWDSK